MQKMMKKMGGGKRGKGLADLGAALGSPLRPR